MDPTLTSLINTQNRRSFIKRVSLGAGATALAGSLPFQACAEPNKKMGIALVGLGSYSTNQLAPALLETEHCQLTGIVTGTPEKAAQWKEKYNIPEQNIYNYETYDQIKDNPDIDIVYVVLPNSMHAEYTIRAAEAGKHVICEKPMANTAKECEDMIAACEKAGVQLAIGYRLHYEPHTREFMRLGQEKVHGGVKVVHAQFGFPLRDTSRWRLQKDMAGGGPLMDVGIYCVQACCYTTGEVPIAVTAQQVKTQPDIYQDIEETLFWQFEFPSGAVANCSTSYACSMERLEVHTETGAWYGLKPAYTYYNITPTTNQKVEAMRFEQVNHQKEHMDAVSLDIQNGKPNGVPGEMGLRDMRIIEAIYQAMESGERVPIEV